MLVSFTLADDFGYVIEVGDAFYAGGSYDLGDAERFIEGGPPPSEDSLTFVNELLAAAGDPHTLDDDATVHAWSAALLRVRAVLQWL